MKEEENSSAGVWITVVTGVVMLYLLSPGMVLVCYDGMHKQPGRWFDTLYSPIISLNAKSTIVRSIYDAYFKALGMR